MACLYVTLSVWDAPFFSSRQAAFIHPLQHLAQCLRVHVMHVSHPLQHLAHQCLRIQISVHVMHAMLNCYRERYKFGHLLKKHKQTNKQTSKQTNKHTHTHRAVILYLCVVLTLAAKNGSLPPFCHIIYNFLFAGHRPQAHRPQTAHRPTNPPPRPTHHTGARDSPKDSPLLCLLGSPISQYVDSGKEADMAS